MFDKSLIGVCEFILDAVIICYSLISLIKKNKENGLAK